MAYSSEEYDQLKAFYKEEYRKRKAIQEQLRRAYLRQKAEWHLAQMQASLERLGVASERESQTDLPSAQPPEADPEPPPAPPKKTLF